MARVRRRRRDRRAQAPGRWTLCNDATAACAAELTLGQGARYGDFLYVFIGSFIGGGVVLNGSLYPGRTGNAGAIGSMPIARAVRDGGPLTQQLIRSASIWVLEKQLLAEGRDTSRLWRSPREWEDFGPALEAWLEEVAGSLALAIAAATAVLDFAAAIVDGAFPAAIGARLVERTGKHLAALDHQGLFAGRRPGFWRGQREARARSGSACLPLLAKFGRDQEVLLKDNGPVAGGRRSALRGPATQRRRPPRAAATGGRPDARASPEAQRMLKAPLAWIPLAAWATVPAPVLFEAVMLPAAM